jgi:hypothetical protein
MALPRVSEVLEDLADAAEEYAIAVQAYDGGLMLGSEASGERGQEGRLLTEDSPTRWLAPTRQFASGASSSWTATERWPA